MPAGLIQERGFQGNEAEMIAVQEALFAQMEQDNEDIYIDDDGDDGDPQPNAQGGGLMNYLSGLIFGNRPPAEEEKKQE